MQIYDLSTVFLEDTSTILEDNSSKTWRTIGRSSRSRQRRLEQFQGATHTLSHHIKEPCLVHRINIAISTKNTVHEVSGFETRDEVEKGVSARGADLVEGQHILQMRKVA